MTSPRSLAALFVAATVVALPLCTSLAQQPHHPPGGVAPQGQPGTAPAGQDGGQRGTMKRMMGGGAGAAGGMHGGMHAGMHAGMHGGMIDRVEGRIAFLRAELKITDAQAKAWDAFAQALRENAKQLGAARAAMTPPAAPSGQSPENPALAQRLEQQERMYAARLDGLRAMKTSLSALLPSLTAEQRKAAEDMLPPHLGLSPEAAMGGAGMGMMHMGGMGMPPMRGGMQ